MENLLVKLHPDLDPVATCDERTTNDTPINGIWTLPGIDAIRGGMLGFGSLAECKSDHRLLWVDIQNESIFGCPPPPLAPVKQKGIPLNDPKIVKKYNNKLKKMRIKHGIDKTLFELEKNIKTGNVKEGADIL